MTTTLEPIQTVGEDFAARVFEASVQALDVFSIYVGEKLGLYAALQAHGPLTRDELTRHADIHWRYAQEWLEQQTASGIVSLDDPALTADRRSYSLPPAHAEVLLDRDSLSYLSPFVRMITRSGIMLPAMIEAFRTGGGVGWHELGDDARSGQADMNRPWFLQSIGSEWFPAIPDLHATLSAGGRVADVGCGEGWSSIAIALAYPQVTVDGFDVDGPSVEAARRHAAEAGVSDRITFHQVDAAELNHEEAAFDAVVGFEFIHDLPHPVSVLEAMRRIAKPGAPVVVMDENVPDDFVGERNEAERVMYGISLFICLPDGMSHQPSAATGTVIRQSTMRTYAREAGFSDVEVMPVEHDLWRFYSLIG